MKIESVQTYRVGTNYLLVEITTDTGLVGLGEAGLWGYRDASDAVIEAFKPYLIGQDPLRIEHHHQYLYRNCHFQGAAISGALGGIDIALWDIKGKHYGAPVWDLLGGKTRDRVRCWYSIHAAGSPDEAAQVARKVVDRGFTAVRLTPFPEGYERMTHTQFIREAVARVAAVRDEVGPNMDIGIEIHRRLGPAASVALAQALAPLGIFFYEDPLLPDSTQSRAQVAAEIPLPVVYGERLRTIWEFRELLDTGACKFIRFDVCLCGGITQAKKIVAMAESHQVGVFPHGPLSPVCTAAIAQIEACVPNMVIHEYTHDDEPPRRDLLVEPLKMDGGYLILPDKPGIGAELNHAALADWAPSLRPIRTSLRDDGSVADQ
ncbi:MAG: mandelate racemase/muconate lactonizing enzyme family protein [Chloroflexi bacterium]|nr:mandelate racemase/muconate lactonizing enzyme family protein [Chloroflexota bacterium]